MENTEAEKKRLRQKVYRENNRELLRSKFILYYNQNKDEINKRRREHYLKSKTTVNDVSDNELHS
jgi:hypothetical protein